MADVLVIDDDANFTAALAHYIQRAGYTARIAQSLEQARSELTQAMPDGILIDILLPDGSGLDILKELEGTPTQVVIMTGYPSLDTAVTGLRARAIDYLVKPIDIQRLRSWLDSLKPANSSSIEIPSDNGAQYGSLIGTSKALRRVYELIQKVASSEATVFLQGESGTGKEVAARTIHELSARRQASFLAFNCGAVTETLLGDDLFGHERGGFTGATRQHKGYFERAHGGTLFLDEITEMPIDLQANLLRVLETGTLIRLGGDKEIKVDVRIITATNRDPQEAIAAGRLREDLYYRLSVFPIPMPPLRSRPEDILVLTEHFLARLNKETGAQKRLTPKALQYLLEQEWPGNVRQLKNELERAHLLAEGDKIEIHHFLYLTDKGYNNGDTSAMPIAVGMPLNEAERQLIFSTLEELGGNKKLAAESLGISLKTLYNKLKRYQAE